MRLIKGFFSGCVRDDECETNAACINRICKNPCDCGKGADCFLSNHRPVCQCPEGTVGNPQIECKPVGCQSDSECQDREACSNGKCINPCLLVSYIYLLLILKKFHQVCLLAQLTQKN